MEEMEKDASPGVGSVFPKELFGLLPEKYRRTLCCIDTQALSEAKDFNEAYAEAHSNAIVESARMVLKATSLTEILEAGGFDAVKTATDYMLSKSGALDEFREIKTRCSRAGAFRVRRLL